MTKKRWIIIIVALGLAITLGGAAYAIFYERYLEAVAVSCIVPVLAWFATGAGKVDK